MDCCCSCCCWFVCTVYTSEREREREKKFNQFRHYVVQIRIFRNFVVKERIKHWSVHVLSVAFSFVLSFSVCVGVHLLKRPLMSCQFRRFYKYKTSALNNCKLYRSYMCEFRVPILRSISRAQKAESLMQNSLLFFLPSLLCGVQCFNAESIYFLNCNHNWMWFVIISTIYSQVIDKVARQNK